MRAAFKAADMEEEEDLTSEKGGVAVTKRDDSAAHRLSSSLLSARALPLELIAVSALVLFLGRLVPAIGFALLEVTEFFFQR